MTMSQAQILDSIKQMSVMDLVGLIEAMEKEFNVSAAAVAVAAAPAGGAPQAQAEEKTEFTVTIKAVGDNKVGVIKVVREVTTLGLKEAKDLVESAPATLKEGVKKEEAAEIKKKLEEAGATIEVK